MTKLGAVKYVSDKSLMSGSGPTVFGIFSQASQAQEAWAQLREDYDEVFLAEPLVQNSIP